MPSDNTVLVKDLVTLEDFSKKPMFLKKFLILVLNFYILKRFNYSRSNGWIKLLMMPYGNVITDEYNRVEPRRD
mgnify:CR=1 FL=1